MHNITYARYKLYLLKMCDLVRIKLCKNEGGEYYYSLISTAYRNIASLYARLLLIRLHDAKTKLTTNISIKY